MQFDFEAPLWEYQGDAAWMFVTVPSDVGAEIRDEVDDAIAAGVRSPAGFGSVKVEVTVGSSTWRTSVFPDKRSGSYMLPVKKAVRNAEGLVEGEPVPVRLVVLGA